MPTCHKMDPCSHISPPSEPTCRYQGSLSLRYSEDTDSCVVPPKKRMYQIWSGKARDSRHISSSKGSRGGCRNVGVGMRPYALRFRIGLASVRVRLRVVVARDQPRKQLAPCKHSYLLSEHLIGPTKKTTWGLPWQHQRLQTPLITRPARPPSPNSKQGKGLEQ